MHMTISIVIMQVTVSVVVFYVAVSSSNFIFFDLEMGWPRKGWGGGGGGYDPPYQLCALLAMVKPKIRSILLMSQTMKEVL